MQGEQLPLTGEQGRVFLLTSPLIGFPNSRLSDRSADLVSWLMANLNGKPIKEELVAAGRGGQGRRFRAVNELQNSAY